MKRPKKFSGTTNATKPSVSERFKIFETRLTSMGNQVQEVLNHQQQRLAVLEKTISALIEIVGREQVEEVISENHRQDLENRAEEQEKRVNEALTSGALTISDTITDDDDDAFLLCLQELDDEGEIKIPSKVYISMSQLSPEMKQALIGKSVGESCVVDSTEKEDTKIEVRVIGIYRRTEGTAHPEDAESAESAEIIESDAVAAATDDEDEVPTTEAQS